VVDSRVTIQFTQTLSGDDVSLRDFPDCRHEAFNEIERDTVFETVGEWLLAFRERNADLA
jgi:alpha-beta hydrolase superfamily lysophospholipase